MYQPSIYAGLRVIFNVYRKCTMCTMCTKIAAEGGDPMRYTEEERALLSNPYCPMMMAGSGHCVKGQCAWWDYVEERCAVHSIAQILGRMQEEMKISNGG